MKEGRGLRHALKLRAAGPAAGAAQSGPGAAPAGQLDGVRGASPGRGAVKERQRRGGVAAPGARCPRAAPLGRTFTTQQQSAGETTAHPPSHVTRQAHALGQS